MTDSRRIVAAAIIAALGGVEWLTWRASRQYLPAGRTDPGVIVPGEDVLVLGCPTKAVHRWRVRIAVRSTDPGVARFVFSGGAVRTAVPEAELMADYARQTLRLPARSIAVETRSTTTVENIVNTTPLLGDSAAIKIASDTWHARRARRILHDQSPELAARLVRARDYIPFEWGLLHAALLVHEAIRRYAAHSKHTRDVQPP